MTEERKMVFQPECVIPVDRVVASYSGSIYHYKFGPFSLMGPCERGNCTLINPEIISTGRRWRRLSVKKLDRFEMKSAGTPGREKEMKLKLTDQPKEE
jgi:hypothetical protein